MSKIRFLLGQYAAWYTDYSANSYWGVDNGYVFGQMEYARKRLLRKGVELSMLKEIDILCSYDPGDMTVTEDDVIAACNEIAAQIAA